MTIIRPSSLPEAILHHHHLPPYCLLLLASHTFQTMCRFEVFGDLYRGCGCFKKSYYSGEKTDCGLAICRNSEKHTHKAPNCPCGAIEQDERRIMNLFQFPCDDCKREEFHRRVGR